MTDPLSPLPKTEVIHGDRVARGAILRPGAAAVLFNEDRTKVLLTRRTDNGPWCLPGGGMDPGESLAEACIREMREETGLIVTVQRLIGVYSSPDWVIVYPDGNRVQAVSACFEVSAVGGTLGLSDETTEFGYFTLAECEVLDMIPHHQHRIRDAFAEYPNTVLG